MKSKKSIMIVCVVLLLCACSSKEGADENNLQPIQTYHTEQTKHLTPQSRIGTGVKPANARGKVAQISAGSTSNQDSLEEYSDSRDDAQAYADSDSQKGYENEPDDFNDMQATADSDLNEDYVEDDFDDGFENDFLYYSQEPTDDPFEWYNRKVFAFNDYVLEKAVKPTHEAYRSVLPEKIHAGLKNFSENLLSPLRVLNAMLQLNFGGAAVETSRFFVNTVTSLGFSDVALKDKPYFYHSKDNYDFTTTLAVWGVPEGPFVTLPFLGPYTVREIVGTGADIVTDPLMFIPGNEVATALMFLEFNKLDKYYVPYEQYKKIAIDPYSGSRDAMLAMTRVRIAKHMAELEKPHVQQNYATQDYPPALRLPLSGAGLPSVQLANFASF